ncbi:uncharacterized protein LOC125490011 [Plutella xylostella]|uniref:uncharacterized protein LOC125490011 n=1 Tax=Plutella xylostella TaxID=51655 RepID=UPI002032D98D|nr:uncharacterized protein LOC125490011 [Plutella xylostella]
MKLPLEEKWEVAKKAYVCFRCLSSTHRGFNCRAKPCGKNGCRGSHHRLLHRDKEGEKESAEPKDTQPTNTPQQAKDKQTHSVNTLCTMKGYLKIVPLKLYGPKNTTEVYALLDEGATITLIEEEVADCIGATGPKEGLCIEGIGGHRMNEPDSRRLKLKIQGRYARNIEKMNAYTISKLSISSQMVPHTLIEDCPHLSDIADVITYDNVRPRIVIGQDNWHLIISQDVKSGDRNKPVASLTRLGWTLHGCATFSTRPVIAVNHIRTTREDKMDELIKHHFSIESLGVTPKTPSNDPEKKANEILEATCRRLPEGRLEAGLLWRTPNETMPNNRENAMKRLIGIEKRLKKDEKLKCEYEKQIRNLLDSDYAEPVPGPSTSSRTWYLPHFAVVHPQKGKVRLVFDAAARSGGKCLNDALLTGPDLLQSLFGVLLRFREGPIAVVSDIKEMFLRIQVCEQDRDSLRFLWREKDSEKPKEYRMKSLIFGAASSPCTAIYAKNRNAADFKEKYPEAVQAIERNHYMDDYLQSFQSEETAKSVISEVDYIHKQGGFLLRGWASNRPQILEQFPEDVRNNGSIDLGKDSEQVEKTLGLRWNVSSDQLNFTLNLRNTPSDAIEGTRPPTKREATSAVMSVFDPLGLASPITVQGRAMLQDVCRTGIGWDEPLKENEERKWKTWLQDLKKLQDLNIPRCTTTKLTEGEIHVFCDASEKAYATAIYWRAIHPDGHVEVKLLSGKSRVAPLKPVSIPRLELQAALLGCRLAATVTKETDLTINKSTYWTDSRTVLAWIKSDPRTFKPFVAHRLAEIEDHTKPTQWRWIPTAQNVADDATRNAPSHFDIQHRWFTGPPFLYCDESEWPEDKSSPNIPTTGEEKPNCALHVINTEEQLIKPEKFSKFTRLLRATARVFQAVDIFKKLIKSRKNQIQVTKKITQDTTWRIKKTAKTIPRKIVPTQQRSTINYVILTQEYLNKAEKYLIRKIQDDCFKSEKHHLKNNTKIPKSSKLKNLTLTLKTEDDIIYLSTRVGAAPYLPHDYKNPAVLDGSHYVTLLLIEEKHRQLHHGNHQTVMNEIRQRYYVTKLRNSVKKITRECLTCKIRRQKPQSAPLGDLPKERLNRYQRPFTCTAVDYFGPMTVTVGRRHEKRWGALFTCLTTRAIHLELANSLSTDSMILALRRMAARRSTPATIYSDNGTNFVGANKELQEQLKSLSQTDLVRETENYGITWKFIPPGAPHMGGAWERLVRSVKTALAATLNERSPKEEVLHTLLLEVEHVTAQIE